MTKRDEVVRQLGNELKSFYNSAPKGESTLRLEYFVIKNSKIILVNNIKPKDLLNAADLGSKKIAPEITRALKLSSYVEIIKPI